MAFVAGVILMYLPEEPAFSVLTRLMGPGGPDLRTLFLPGASQTIAITALPYQYHC